jgi:hypothetical protein
VRYYVTSFGRDYRGNCAGWMVADRNKWRQPDNGCVRTFVASINEPEQRAAAFQAALALADQLNERTFR